MHQISGVEPMEKLKSYLPLNFGLLSNPVNWAIVFLMVAMAGVALALIFKPAGVSPSANIEE